MNFRWVGFALVGVEGCAQISFWGQLAEMRHSSAWLELLCMPNLLATRQRRDSGGFRLGFGCRLGRFLRLWVGGDFACLVRLPSATAKLPQEPRRQIVNWQRKGLLTL